MKNLLRLLDHILGRTFVNIASFASIISLVIIAFSSKYQAYIALVCIILFLGTVLFQIYNFLNKYLASHSSTGYKNLATYSRYATNDGKIVTYETHKYIVCKKMIMDGHEHGYMWTGSHKPVISSDTMEIENHIETEAGKFDKVFLRFKAPLLYNDFAIMHLKMELDDSDHKSKTFLEHFVRAKLQLISFSVELKHKNRSVKDARLMRKKLDTQVDLPYELMKTIPFDKSSCSYQFNFYNPPPGYAYKLEWDR